MWLCAAFDVWFYSIDRYVWLWPDKYILHVWRLRGKSGKMLSILISRSSNDWSKLCILSSLSCTEDAQWCGLIFRPWSRDWLWTLLLQCGRWLAALWRWGIQNSKPGVQSCPRFPSILGLEPISQSVPLLRDLIKPYLLCFKAPKLTNTINAESWVSVISRTQLCGAVQAAVMDRRQCYQSWPCKAHLSLASSTDIRNLYTTVHAFWVIPHDLMLRLLWYIEHSVDLDTFVSSMWSCFLSLGKVSAWSSQ